MTALAGIRVVELAREPIAFVGKLCGDMGADVILVEPPGGDPCRNYPPFLDDTPGEDRSLYWWHYHTSKRSVVIDLDLDEPGRCRRAFARLSRPRMFCIEARAPPGRLAGLGPRLRRPDPASRPNLVHASVTPYGRSDPKSEPPVRRTSRIMAAGGPVWSCGYDDHSLPPVRGPQQGYHTASHFAVAVAPHGTWSIATSPARGSSSTSAMHAALQRHDGRLASYSAGSSRGSPRWSGRPGRHAAVNPSSETQPTLRGRTPSPTTGVPPRTQSGGVRHAAANGCGSWVLSSELARGRLPGNGGRVGGARSTCRRIGRGRRRSPPSSAQDARP